MGKYNTTRVLQKGTTFQNNFPQSNAPLKKKWQILCREVTVSASIFSIIVLRSPVTLLSFMLTCNSNPKS